jgi:two-component system nitrate/nitrite response regulator NarL
VSIRVLIADDHAPTREDVRAALEQDAEFEVCAEAVDAPGAVAGALRERPDVCLLDVHMPGRGVAAAWEIHSRLPRSKVVMLTVSRDDVDLFAALRAGALGYLLKDMNPRSLPRALHSVLAGEVAIPRELVSHVVEGFRDPSARRRQAFAEGSAQQLTSREWQVLELLRQDLSTAQIARRLVLSPVTVRTHVNAILRKLHLRDRDELRRHFSETDR